MKQRVPNFENTIKLIKFLTWFYKIFSMKKRIQTIIYKDGKEWHVPQIKTGIFSSWKRLCVHGDVQVFPTDGSAPYADFSKASMQFEKNEYSSFVIFEDAVRCANAFELLWNLEKSKKNQKVKYTYL